MGKLPAFLFYPKDWLTDSALRTCSLGARGMWIEMLCLMFGGPDRGVLTHPGGSAWSDQEIAEAISGDTGANLACLAELLAKGVASRNECGAIFSRRLVRDEQQRQANKQYVRDFRAKMKGGCKVDCKADVRPLYGTATVSTQTKNKPIKNKEPSKNKHPTFEEVREYCETRNNGVNPRKWLSHYEANGWMVGRNPMRDWQAAVRTWEDGLWPTEGETYGGGGDRGLVAQDRAGPDPALKCDQCGRQGAWKFGSGNFCSTCIGRVSRAESAGSS